MDVCNSPEIFQEKISELFEGFDIVRMYVDVVLIITKDDFTNHPKAMEKSPTRSAEVGLKYIPRKIILWMNRN